jgi:hypothetical protein
MRKKCKGGLVNISFLKTAAKVLFFPIYLPAKIAKNQYDKSKPNPIVAIISAERPESYAYYFEGTNFRTDTIGNQIVVWRENISEGERRKVLKKLTEVV